MLGNRISIVGKSGSGKSFLAQQLSDRLDYKYIELDALHWLPDWQGRDTEDFRSLVQEKIMGSDRWIADGNYNSSVRAYVWSQADTVIWLDYPLWIVWFRILRRTIKRSITRENLWNSGNRERLWPQFFNLQESLFVWSWKQHRRHPKRYPELLNLPEYSHLSFIHLRSPRETRQFVKRMTEIAQLRTTPQHTA